MSFHTRGIGGLGWGALTPTGTRRQVLGTTSAKKKNSSISKKKKRRNNNSKNARVGSEAPDDVLSSETAAPIVILESPKSDDLQKPEAPRVGATLGFTFFPKEQEPELKPVVPPEPELDYQPSVDLVSGGADAAEQLPIVTRSQVLGACVRVSLGMLAVTLPSRGYASIMAASAMGTNQDDVDRLLSLPTSVDGVHLALAVGVAALVTAARFSLLQVWPDFADAIDRSNRQVLPDLGPLDLVVVAFLPGIAEEALFRGTLIPATFPDWRGVILAGALFGVLHNNGGRNWAFAVWAGAVGVLYGMLFLFTEDLLAPVMAHSLANLGSASLWLATRKDLS